MSKLRNYWIYSLGLGIAWAVVLAIVFVAKGPGMGQILLTVFGGFCIGWVSTTIARYVYPPPQKWRNLPNDDIANDG